MGPDARQSPAFYSEARGHPVVCRTRKGRQLRWRPSRGGQGMRENLLARPCHNEQAQTTLLGTRHTTQTTDQPRTTGSSVLLSETCVQTLRPEIKAQQDKFNSRREPTSCRKRLFALKSARCVPAMPKSKSPETNGSAVLLGKHQRQGDIIRVSRLALYEWAPVGTATTPDRHIRHQ